jgi:hypothetical protein
MVAFSTGGVSGGLSKYVDEYQQLLSKISEGEGEKAYREYLQKLPEQAEARKKEDLNMALIMGGLGAVAGAKPTTGNVLGDLLGAVGTAGQVGVPYYVEGAKSRRASEEAAIKGRADLDRMSRSEKIEALKGGMGLYGKELDRAAQIDAANIAAGKQTDMKFYADLKLAASKGDKEAAIKVAAIEQYLPLVGSAGVRAQAALTQAGIAGDKLSSADFKAAKEYAEAQIGLGGPKRGEYVKRQREDSKNAKAGNPTNLAGEFEDSLTSQFLGGLDAQRGGAPSSPAPKPTPTAAPAASGQPQGRFEVAAPNGKVYTFTTKEQADAFRKQFSK